MGYERGLIKRYAGNGIYLYLDYIVQSNTKYRIANTMQLEKFKLKLIIKWKQYQAYFKKYIAISSYNYIAY